MIDHWQFSPSNIHHIWRPGIIRLQGRYRTNSLGRIWCSGTKFLSRLGNTSSSSSDARIEGHENAHRHSFADEDPNEIDPHWKKKKEKTTYSLVSGVSRSQTMSMPGLIESPDDAPLKTSGREQNEFETINLNARCNWRDVSNSRRVTA